MRLSQSLGTVGRQAGLRSESRTASSQTGEGKVSPENLRISSGGARSNMDARSFVVALQLEAAGLKRLTTEDKQRGKPARYVDQSSALGSLLVERGDTQQAYGTKVRPNSSKNPGVLRAKTLKTSRHSSLTSRSGDPIRERVRGPLLEPAKSQRGRKLRWLRRLQGVPGVPGVEGEAAAMSPKEETHRHRQRSWSRWQQRT